jgi:NADH dehydrogenase FAD-containing subunit
MNTHHKVVIIGGGYAGLMTALRLAGKSKAQSPQITLVNASDTFVERIRQHQVATEQYPRRHRIADLLGRRPIEFVQGYVTGLEPDEQTVTIAIGDAIQTLSYDTLVYALGSTITTDRIPGLTDHAYVLNGSGPNSTAALAEKLPEIAARGGRLLVIGGGLTGIEGATEIAEAYPDLKVTLATQDILGTGLSGRGREHLRKVMRDLNIELREHTTIEGIEANAARLADGNSLSFDLCLWAGAFAVPALAREAGLQVDELGRIVTDERLRSKSHPNIVAVGDAATRAGHPLRMACATAMAMAAHAADNIAHVLQGEQETHFRFAYVVQCISLGRREALVQMVDERDQPLDRIFTGRLGAFIKEFICRFTIWALKLERWLPGTYIIPKPRRSALEYSVPVDEKMHQGLS